jgi:hypothetical protein
MVKKLKRPKIRECLFPRTLPRCRQQRCLRYDITKPRRREWQGKPRTNIFTIRDVLALTPEEFGGELMPPLLQNGMFNPAAFIAQVYQVVGPSYPPGSKRAVELAVAEALGRSNRAVLKWLRAGWPRGYLVKMFQSRDIQCLTGPLKSRRNAPSVDCGSWSRRLLKHL